MEELLIQLQTTNKASIVDAINEVNTKASTETYTLPTATASVLGGVKTGTNIVNTSGVISVADGTTSIKGLVQLTDSTASTSTTTAATPNAVKTVNDSLTTHRNDTTSHITATERAAWNAKAGTSVATTTTAGLMSAADKTKLDGTSAYTLPVATSSVLGGVKTGENLSNTSGLIAVPNGSTTVKGVIQLTDSVASTSTTTAATANAVKTAYDLAASKAANTVATTSANGLLSAADKVKLDGITGTGSYVLPQATASVLGGVTIGTNITVSAGTISVANASTSARGLVQLNNAVNSTATDQAATANAVKTAYDLANGKASTQEWTVTLATTDWSLANGIYSATKTLTGVLAEDRPFVSLNASSETTGNGISSLLREYNKLSRVSTTANTVKFECALRMPSAAMTVIVKVVR